MQAAAPMSLPSAHRPAVRPQPRQLPGQHTSLGGREHLRGHRRPVPCGGSLGPHSPCGPSLASLTSSGSVMETGSCRWMQARAWEEPERMRWALVQLDPAGPLAAPRPPASGLARGQVQLDKLGKGQRARVVHRGAPHLAWPAPHLHSRPSCPACVACDLSLAGRVSQVTRGGHAWFPSGRRAQVGPRSRSSLSWGQRLPPAHRVAVGKSFALPDPLGYGSKDVVSTTDPGGLTG